MRQKKSCTGTNTPAKSKKSVGDESQPPKQDSKTIQTRSSAAAAGGSSSNNPPPVKAGSSSSKKRDTPTTKPKKDKGKQWAEPLATQAAIPVAGEAMEIEEVVPPVLIEVQYQVNQDFMIRLISYACNAYRRYGKLPIVLVIVTKSFSSTKFQNEFSITSEGFLLEASCKFWAQQCFLLTAYAVSNHFNEQTLHPLAALGYFLTHYTLHQIPPHHWQNPTLKLIFSTVKDVLSKEDNDMIYKTSVRYIMDQTKRQRTQT